MRFQISVFATRGQLVVEASNVIYDPKCNKGPKCNKVLTLNVIKVLSLINLAPLYLTKNPDSSTVKTLV